MGSDDPSENLAMESKPRDHSSDKNGHVDTEFEAEGSLAGFDSLEALLEVTYVAAWFSGPALYDAL